MGRYAEAETVYREVLDVPEPSRLIPNLLAERASRRKALRREAYNRLLTFVLLTHHWLISRNFASSHILFRLRAWCQDLTNPGTRGSHV
jgi:hypothetical protein